MSQYPVAPKVQAASLTAAVSGAALWLLGHYVFKGSVPDGIASMVYITVPGVLAYAAGWLAPHQDRTPPPVPLAPAAWQSTVRVLPPEERPTIPGDDPGPAGTGSTRAG